MATIKAIYDMGADDRAALNQAAFDLVDKSGVTPSGVAYHAYAIKHWPKVAGPKPTAAMWALPYIIDPVRRGGRESMQFTMGLRPEGVLVAEYEAVPFADGHYPRGAAHNNIAKYTDQVRGGVTGIGWFARIAEGEGRSLRFRYVITDKGMVHLTKRLAALTGTAEAKPTKAMPAKGPVAVRVARKRNQATSVAPAETPISEPAAVTEGTTSLLATVEAIAALADHFNS